jgi:hypothetical protein
VLVFYSFYRPIEFFFFATKHDIVPKVYMAKAQHPRSRSQSGVACARESERGEGMGRGQVGEQRRNYTKSSYNRARSNGIKLS